jgi:hypothetical protein
MIFNFLTIPSSVIAYFNKERDKNQIKTNKYIASIKNKKNKTIVKYPNDINKWPDKTFNKEFYNMACAITDLGMWDLLKEKNALNYINVNSKNYYKIRAILYHKKVKECGHSLFSSSFAYTGMVELANLGFVKFTRLIKNKYYRNNRRNPKRLCRKIKRY